MTVFYLLTSLHSLFVSLVILSGIYFIGYFFLKKLGRDPKNILPVNFFNRVQKPFFILLFSILFLLVSNFYSDIDTVWISIINILGKLGIITCITWALIIVVKVFKIRILKNYNISEDDNLKARKVYTQFIILENTLIFIIVVMAIAIALMSFSGIRTIGVSILTSAGIAGLILGFAAQKALGTLFAGIQIAFTQPIRIGDAVIIEGEWGWIEEITLTYIVLRIWDKRRLIVPSTYFIENTFENWTRTTADIIGTVFLYTDYNIPLDEVRKELTRLLKSNEHWDGKVNVLQVTDATEKTMQIRILVSAATSPQAWDLRVFIREKIIEYIRENFPESLPRMRIDFEKDDKKAL